jgi:hypothetical protein
MKSLQTPRPHHELAIGGMAPWPVPGIVTVEEVTADPAARCCQECGRRLLLLLLRSSVWVSHRTEHVSFRDDLSMMRQVTVEFHVPEQAPVFRGDGQTYSLVPLSIMRRKTLLGFELHDKEGRAVVLPSLRHNQAITESMLLACADATIGWTNGSESTDAVSRREIAAFIHEVVSGTQQRLAAAYAGLETGSAAPAVLSLGKQRMFRAVLDRFTDNFVLWVMIPNGGSRQRVLTFSYSESLWPYYREPGFQGNRYNLGRRLSPWRPIVWCAALGLTPTRIEFPVPAAESTTSFHFEIDAPKGVRIVEGSLLAGRPNEANPAVDNQRGSFPAIGLHVTEVPYGSLSRAQIALQAVTSGWMTTSMLSSWVVFVLLLTFATHHADMTRDSGLPALIFAALATQIAGLFAQSNAYGLAAYLLKRARVFATVAAFLPLATVYIALAIVFSHIGLVLWTVVGIGGTIAAILSAVCFASWYYQRSTILSPWEQSRARRDDARRPESFEAAVKKYRYDKPAVRAGSAEGGTTEFYWDQKTEDELTTTLASQYSHHVLYGTKKLDSKSSWIPGRTANASVPRLLCTASDTISQPLATNWSPI